MNHRHPEGSSIVIHRSRLYDLVFGRLIRKTDAEILRRAGVGPGDHLLDVGTGPGYLALAAAALVGPDGAAMGIDAAPEMIERARMQARRNGSNAEYVLASADALPFEDDTFEEVVSRLVMHHLPGEMKQTALGEMARVLKPGGRLLIADMASPAARGAHHLAAYVLGSHPEVEGNLEELVHSAGFVQITSGRLAHGILAGVAARVPERSSQE